MNAMRFLLTIIFLMLLGTALSAQELLVNVKVDATRIQGDKQIFADMEKNISRYMNLTQFTSDEFQAHERIRGNMQIVVTERPAADYFKCNLNLQVFRPVYNTTYETILINLGDTKFSFNYVPFQQLNFVENTYTDNLTALLNFYAFLMIGFDYDSFAPEGGDKWFQAAQSIVNLASNSSEPGWRSGSDQQSRYWIMENLQNSSYKVFHQVMYDYHRQGLDLMESDPAKGRQGVLSALEAMKGLVRQFPILQLTRVFLDTKSNELVKIFGEATPGDKERFVELMRDIDPSNIEKYNEVLSQR